MRFYFNFHCMLLCALRMLCSTGGEVAVHTKDMSVEEVSTKATSQLQTGGGMLMLSHVTSFRATLLYNLYQL